MIFIYKSKKIICNGFIELLNLKNFNDIIIKDILTQSNISRGCFYNNFQTKNDVMLFLFQDLDKKISNDFYKYISENIFVNKNKLINVFVDKVLYNIYLNSNILRKLYESSIHSNWEEYLLKTFSTKLEQRFSFSVSIIDLNLFILNIISILRVLLVNYVEIPLNKFKDKFIMLINKKTIDII